MAQVVFSELPSSRQVFPQNSESWCDVRAMVVNRGSAVARITSIGTNRCGVQVSHCTGCMIVNEKWIQHLSAGTTLTMSGFNVSWENGEIQFDTTCEGALILLHAGVQRGEKKIAEVFSGISGWSIASKHMGIHTHLWVDNDPCVAAACSRQHGVPVKSVDQAFLDAMNGDLQSCVIVGTVDSPLVWMTFGLHNIEHVMGSPPCQPWSGAGFCSGLAAADGNIFLSCLQWAALGHMASFTAENVPGLPRHQDFDVLTREAEKAGMVLRLHGVFQVNSILPVQRDRWLGSFLHKDVGVDVQKLRIASSFSFAQGHFSDVCVNPCISTKDVIHVHMSDWEREELVVPDAAYRAMSNPRYAPKWLVDRVLEFSPQALIEGRVIVWDSQFQGFMACYGSQHEIDASLLEKRGFTQ